MLRFVTNGLKLEANLAKMFLGFIVLKGTRDFVQNVPDISACERVRDSGF